MDLVALNAQEIACTKPGHRVRTNEKTRESGQCRVATTCHMYIPAKLQLLILSVSNWGGGEAHHASSEARASCLLLPIFTSVSEVDLFIIGISLKNESG